MKIESINKYNNLKYTQNKQNKQKTKIYYRKAMKLQLRNKLDKLKIHNNLKRRQNGLLNNNKNCKSLLAFMEKNGSK